MCLPSRCVINHVLYACKLYHSNMDDCMLGCKHGIVHIRCTQTPPNAHASHCDVLTHLRMLTRHICCPDASANSADSNTAERMCVRHHASSLHKPDPSSTRYSTRETFPKCMSSVEIMLARVMKWLIRPFALRKTNDWIASCIQSSSQSFQCDLCTFHMHSFVDKKKYTTIHSHQHYRVYAVFVHYAQFHLNRLPSPFGVRQPYISLQVHIALWNK